MMPLTAAAKPPALGQSVSSPHSGDGSPIIGKRSQPVSIGRTPSASSLEVLASASVDGSFYAIGATPTRAAPSAGIRSSQVVSPRSELASPGTSVGNPPASTTLINVGKRFKERANKDSILWDVLASFSLDVEALSNEEADSAGDSHVCRLVLTGGPCGGKTTALSTIADFLRSLGTQVFVVPENATIFANGGAAFPVHSSKKHQMCWESSRILCQIQMENSFIRIARASGKPTVILCDRGTMDAAAYMDTQRWAELLDQMNWQTDMLREDRYDAVIHLVSAAIGAEEYYTLQTNEARRETVAEAANLDLKIREVWKGHPHVEIIENFTTDFNQKVTRALEAICRILSIKAPTSNGVYQIYNIDPAVKEKLPLLCLRFEEFSIQTVFLQNSTEDENQSVRCRRQHDTGTAELSLYTWASRTLLPNGKFAIEERAITSKEYFALLKQADPMLAPVRRRRRCFLHEDQYFQLDEYEEYVLLSVEVSNEDTLVNLPSWIKPYNLGNVTKDPRYRLFSCAQRLGALDAAKRMTRTTSAGPDMKKPFLADKNLCRAIGLQVQPKQAFTGSDIDSMRCGEADYPLSSSYLRVGDEEASLDRFDPEALKQSTPTPALLTAESSLTSYHSHPIPTSCAPGGDLELLTDPNFHV